MSNPYPDTVVPCIPTLDLNELFLDHPGASFIFQLNADVAIVDRAAEPDDGCLVLVESDNAFSVGLYHGQLIFGVITHLVRRMN